MRITIFDRKGNKAYSVPVGDSSSYVWKLMSEEYVNIVFKSRIALDLKKGYYADIDGLGRFEIVDLPLPSRQNSATGYSYELRMDRPWYKLKNRIMFFDRGTVLGKESTWQLTDTLPVHLSLVIGNINSLGYTYIDEPYSVEIQDDIDTTIMKEVSYDSTSILDALNAIVEAFEDLKIEWWFEGAILHIGKCEQGDAIKMRVGGQYELQSPLSKQDSSGEYGTRLYAFGSTRNLNKNYRRKLNNPFHIGGVEKYDGSWYFYFSDFEIPEKGIGTDSALKSSKGGFNFDYSGSITKDDGTPVLDGEILYKAKGDAGSIIKKGDEVTVSGLNLMYVSKLYTIPEDSSSSETANIKELSETRLRMPKGVDYIDASEDMDEDDVVEIRKVYEDIYPRAVLTIKELTTVDAQTTDTDTGNVEKWKAYRMRLAYSDGSAFSFSKDWVTEDLICHFESGDLNGEDYNLTFNPDSDDDETNLFEIVRNDNYGPDLPSAAKHPKIGDTLNLTGFDISMVDATLVSKAEKELEQRARADMAKMQLDDYTYSAKTNPVRCSGWLNNVYNESYKRNLSYGQKVTLIDTAVFFNSTHSRESRVIGFEKQLNDLYNATYTFGESVAYSRLNDLQGTVEQLTYLTGNTSSGSIGISDLYKQIDWIKRHKLDKIVNDIAEGLITFKQGLVAIGLSLFQNGAQFGTFVKSLYAGTGAAIDKQGNTEVESIRVRSYAEIMELIVNRLSAIEGDQLLTEADTIESVTADEDGTYTLKLKSKWEGYFTAQAENNVLKGIMNTLAKGSGEYHTAWFRVNSVNTANNSINVSMYPDGETPAGKNFPPEEMMKIARWGNQTDTTRQSCLYLSSTEGRIVKLVNVTKPIIDKENYGATLGSLPDFVRTLTDDNGNLLPIREGLDYLYAPGIVTMDIIRLNKWTLKRIPTFVDRGKWKDGEKYYCETENPATGEYETSDVWYYGCKWRCCKNLTTTAPSWNNTDWAMVEGNPDFSVDFAEAESTVDPDKINIPLTLVAKLYNMDVTDDIKASDVEWTRYSEDASGNERTALDNAWSLKHADSGKSIVLTKDDMDMGAYMPKVIRFTATATLRDGEGNAAAKNSVTYDYE